MHMTLNKEFTLATAHRQTSYQGLHEAVQTRNEDALGGETKGFMPEQEFCRYNQRL